MNISNILSLEHIHEYWSTWLCGEKIDGGGQGQICKTYPIYCNALSLDHFSFVTKIIKLQNDDMMNDIVNHYRFVRKQGLMNVYGVYHDVYNNNIMIVMEYLQYTLDTRWMINNDHYLKKFVWQIALQLDIIHKNNGIHLDLKPSNLMKKDNDNWIIIDFDYMAICNERAHFDKNKNVVYDAVKLYNYRGTPGWASPEMTMLLDPDYKKNKNKPVITHKSDIFSFGLIILCIITNGYQPFIGDYFEQNGLNHEAVIRRMVCFIRKLFIFPNILFMNFCYKMF